MTTRKLYLIRHAKAEDPFLGKKDYDRSIVDKGRERSERIAKELCGTLTIDDATLVISSPAKRAIQTAELFAKVLRYPPERIVKKMEIYEAHYLDILRVINAVDERFEKLLVFGHNPGLSQLTDYLTGTYVELKTSNIVVIELEKDVRFGELSGGTASLKNVFR